MIPAGTRIDVMKLDIEEGEISAFEGMGALLDHPHMIFCEYRTSAVARFMPPAEYLEGFSRRGFSLHLSLPEGSTPALTAAEIVARAGDRIENLLLKR